MKMMKLIGTAVCAVLIGVAVFCFAESDPINPAVVTTPQVRLYGTYPFVIYGTNVTVNADLLNGLASGTSTLVSNATLKVYCQYMITTTAPQINTAYTANGTLTNGPSNLLPAGTSNTNGVWVGIVVNGTNLVIKAYPQ